MVSGSLCPISLIKLEFNIRLVVIGQRLHKEDRGPRRGPHLSGPQKQLGGLMRQLGGLRSQLGGPQGQLGGRWRKINEVLHGQRFPIIGNPYASLISKVAVRVGLEGS